MQDMQAYVHARDFAGGKWNVDFTANRKAAHSWSRKREAEIEAATLEQQPIKIKTADRKDNVCTGYKVEERAPGEFILSIVGPFKCLC
jgi:hypothetical protein